ncbi:MAG: class I SAM-dependent methyltransferase [Vicinamibacterales bacterium]
MTHQSTLDEPAAGVAAATATIAPIAQELDDVVKEVSRLGSYRQVPAADGLHLAMSLTHRAILGIAELQQVGWSRERIMGRLEPSRTVHAESPFVRRLQAWPRGYPGDFETIEYLIQQRNTGIPGRFSYWLEQVTLDSAMAQQHRNKVELQARAILETVLASSCGTEQPRVLVLAAGGSPDLRAIQSILSAQRFRAVLLDQDEGALAFSASSLPLLADRLTLVNRNVVRGLQDVRHLGPFDLVLAGGLFDYLPDRVATLVLRCAYQHLLAPGGQMFFTNIGETNLYRPWIEHMVDWVLIHRSEADVRSLCVEAGYSDAAVSVSRERTGLTLVVTARRDSGTADARSR